jgi:hypothetical protein
MDLESPARHEPVFGNCLGRSLPPPRSALINHASELQEEQMDRIGRMDRINNNCLNTLWVE